MKSIDYCKPKSMYREIGNIISNYVEPLGLSVVRSYNGHGVGNFFDIPELKNLLNFAIKLQLF